MGNEEHVPHLVTLIWQRFQGVPIREIELTLIEEGWSIRVIREAIGIYRSARQFI